MCIATRCVLALPILKPCVPPLPEDDNQQQMYPGNHAFTRTMYPNLLQTKYGPCTHSHLGLRDFHVCYFTQSFHHLGRPDTPNLGARVLSEPIKSSHQGCANRIDLACNTRAIRKRRKTACITVSIRSLPQDFPLHNACHSQEQEVHTIPPGRPGPPFTMDFAGVSWSMTVSLKDCFQAQSEGSSL